MGLNTGRRQNLDNLPTSDTEPNSKRKAAQAAVDAAAQALAQEDGMSDEGFGMDEGEAPPPYMPTLPEGMETSASKPQVSMCDKNFCAYLNILRLNFGCSSVPSKVPSL